MEFYNEYTYSYPGMVTSSEESVLMTFLMIYVGIFLVIGIVGLAGYVIKGIGMYRMAQREGMENPWLAFVPFARTYLQGELSGDIEFKKKSIQNPGIWLIVLPIGGSVLLGVLYVVLILIMAGSIIMVDSVGGGIGGPLVLMMIVLVLFVLAAVLYQALITVLKALVNYQIFRKFTSNSMSIVHAILCNIVPLYEAIVLFVYRNNSYNPGMEPNIPVQPEGVPMQSGGAEGGFIYTDRPNEVKKPEEPAAEQEIVPEEVPVQEEVSEESVVQAKAETEKKPYVYSDSVELSSQEPDRYDV